MPICHLLPGPEQGTRFAIAGADLEEKDEGWACFSPISLIFDPGLAIALGWGGGEGRGGRGGGEQHGQWLGQGL